MDDLTWTLRLSNKLRDRITPLAHHDGLDPASYARHLLTKAVQEKAAAEY